MVFKNFVQCFPFETGGHLLKKHMKRKSRGVSPAFSQIWSVISVVNLVLIWYTENGRRDDGYGNRGGRIVEGCLMFELSDHYMKRVRETL